MPDFEVATNFFLVLTLVADALVGVALVLGVGALVSTRARSWWRGLADALAPNALAVAWIVALVTMLGSLYYSEHLGFIPCELCWYQRIAMYPLTVVLAVAWLRRDAKGWVTALPFVVIGAPISLYHWLVERVPSIADTTSCSAVAPCSTPYFEKLGFVTLAWMCLSSFLLIGALLALDATAGAATASSSGDAPTVDDHVTAAPAGDRRPDDQHRDDRRDTRRDTEHDDRHDDLEEIPS